MVGGVFQASNTANFSSGVVTLHKITTAPTAGVLTTVSVSDPTAYRYFRYLSPNGGYCNIAELAFSWITTGGRVTSGDPVLPWRLFFVFRIVGNR